MFSDIRLSYKLPSLVLISSILIGVGIGFTSYITASSKIHELAKNNLQGAAHMGAEDFKKYLQTIEKELIIVAENLFTINALEEFSGVWKAWSSFGGDPKAELQAAYIANNPHPLGSKHLLDRADSGSHYDVVHEKYHPWFRKLQQISGYHDVFLFDAAGNLVYSVFKEPDYATNFKSEDSGQWAKTDLGVVFREAFAAGSKNATDPIVFEDFASYGPSMDEPASFIAHPIKNVEGKTIGVLAFQMPVDEINKAFSVGYGLGESGEIALVGEDGFMRNDSKNTSDTNDILKTHLETDFLTTAYSGTSVTGTDNLYRNELMSVGAEGFSYRGSRYAVVSMQSKRETMQPVYAIRDRMAVTGLLLLSVIGLIGFFMARSVTKPISKLVSEMNELADGSTTVKLTDATRGDEIGDMSKAVVVFRDGQVERNRLEELSAEQDEKQQERIRLVNQMIEEFQGQVATGLQSVAVNANQMTDTAIKLTRISNETSDKASSANSASEGASLNVQSVATSSEELSVSVEEISRQIDRASTVVHSATQNTTATNDKVSELSEAASRIGTVVSLIQDIAEQTNLLALNAAIEAARAGDAGRGFSVVASEVKELASQTAKATEEISSQVSAIQSSTGDAVEAIGQISGTMGDISNYMTSISDVMEEQKQAASEISENVSQAAIGTQAVAQNISGVSTATDESTQSADEVLHASQAVQEETERLNVLISTFLKEVAAA